MKNLLTRFDLGFICGFTLFLTLWVLSGKLPEWVLVPSGIILFFVLRFLAGRVKN